MPRSVTELFLRQSVKRLRNDYLPKIRRCVERLDDKQLWWRPMGGSNSIGNILLHLEGNLRQWVVHGLGGAEDVRARDAEFAAAGGIAGGELMDRLEAVIDEAADVILAMTTEELESPITIQDYKTDGLSAVYHVVEHFSGHTGQVIWITKCITGRGLDFYDL